MAILPPLYVYRKPKETKRNSFYDLQRWRKLSKRHRREEPLCRECKKRGIITKGTLVDHIVAMNDGGEKWDEDNLQTLCDICHQVKRQGEKQREHRRK